MGGKNTKKPARYSNYFVFCANVVIVLYKKKNSIDFRINTVAFSSYLFQYGIFYKILKTVTLNGGNCSSIE
jgi:hypothetical protein